MDQGFVDLRANSDGCSGNDSFWPSFTDIMTVVVMIFLLASTVLILKNWELVTELRASMLAEQQASELVESTTAENETLEERLAQAQHQLSLTRMRLMQADERNREVVRQLADREQRLVEAEAQARQLSTHLAAVSQQNQSLQDRLQQVTGELSGVQAAYTQQSSRLETTLEQLASLEQSSAQQSAELSRLRHLSTQTQQQLASLKDEFSSLQVKYDKLVRPARTAQGKYVVEVRYSKADGRYQISLKAPGENTVRRPVSRTDLDRRLKALKDKYGDQLYVKIIIPEHSGLSYNEAWNFTQEMLRNYDYYYQTPPKKEADGGGDDAQ